MVRVALQDGFFIFIFYFFCIAAQLMGRRHLTAPEEDIFKKFP